MSNGAANGFRFEQRVGAVSLQVEVSRHQGGVVHQDLIRGGGVGAQLFRAQQHFHLRVIPCQTFHNRWRIGIHHHLVNGFYAQKSFDDMRVERLAAHHAVILAGDAFGVVAHGHQSGDLFEFQRGSSLSIKSPPRRMPS